MDAAVPIASIPVLMSSVAYILALETVLGLSVGHAETEAVMENLLLGMEVALNADTDGNAATSSQPDIAE